MALRLSLQKGNAAVLMRSYVPATSTEGGETGKVHLHFIFADPDLLDHGLDDLALLLKGEVRPAPMEILGSREELLAREELNLRKVDLAPKPRQLLFEFPEPLL